MMCTRLTQSVINAALAAGLVSYSAQASGPQAAAPQGPSSGQSPIAAQREASSEAEANSTATPTDTCGAVPDVADKTERARALLARSRCLFASGKIRECVPVLEEACRLTDSPRCLFNLAHVHHALLHCELARGYYQEYLDRDPYDVGREDALTALEELNGVCGPPKESSLPQPAPLTQPPPQQLPPPAPAPQDSTRRIVAYSLFGAAGATAITAAFFGAYGQRIQRKNQDHVDETRNPDDAESRSMDRRGHDYNVVAWSFLASTAALAGTGVLLVVLDANASSEQSVTLGADGLTSVQYRARF